MPGTGYGSKPSATPAPPTLTKTAMGPPGRVTRASAATARGAVAKSTSVDWDQGCGWVVGAVEHIAARKNSQVWMRGGVGGGVRWPPGIHGVILAAIDQGSDDTREQTSGSVAGKRRYSIAAWAPSLPVRPLCLLREPPLPPFLRVGSRPLRPRTCLKPEQGGLKRQARTERHHDAPLAAPRPAGAQQPLQDEQHGGR